MWYNRGKQRDGMNIMIFYHTLSALNCLTFERSDIIYDRKRKK